MGGAKALNRMCFKTTIRLLVAVLLSAAALWFLEGRQAIEEQRRRAALHALRIDPGRLTALNFERDGEVIECRRVDGVWRIAQPVDARADVAQMDRILSLFSSLRRGAVITRRERLTEGLDLRDYGLDPPQARLTWIQDGLWQTVWIGRPATLGDAIYVMQEGAEEIVSVPARLMSVWPESAAALRDRLLFQGDPRRAYRVEIRGGDGFLQIQKTDEGLWRIQRPVAAAADRLAVQQWLDRLFEWRIVDFAADAMADTAVYGLDDSATRIRVWTEGRAEGQTVWIGLETDAEKQLLYARREDGQAVLTVPAEVMEMARVRPEDLRDRTVVPLAAEAVRRIRMQRGEQEVVLEREHGAWMVVSPRRWPADGDRVEALLERWTRARMAGFVDDFDAGTEPADGFQIAFQTGDDPPRRLVIAETVSEAEPGRRRWRRLEERMEFTMTEPLAEDMVMDPLYYRHRLVLELNPADVLRVQQTVEGVDCVAERREQDRWVFPAGVDVEIAEARLRRILLLLTDLRAEHYLPEDPAGWEAYGLVSPQVVWSFSLTAEAGIARHLLLGAADPDGRVPARTRGGDVAFLLDRDTADLLLGPLCGEPPAVEPSGPADGAAGAGDEE
jgi:hypothetical protein